MLVAHITTNTQTINYQTNAKKKLCSFILINKYLCDKYTTELLTFFM